MKKKILLPLLLATATGTSGCTLGIEIDHMRLCSERDCMRSTTTTGGTSSSTDKDGPNFWGGIAGVASVPVPVPQPTVTTETKSTITTNQLPEATR